MRTFSCFTYDRNHRVPTLSFIFAADESRARTLAMRELADVRDAVSLELCENERVVWTEGLRP